MLLLELIVCGIPEECLSGCEIDDFNPVCASDKHGNKLTFKNKCSFDYNKSKYTDLGMTGRFCLYKCSCNFDFRLCSIASRRMLIRRSICTIFEYYNKLYCLYAYIFQSLVTPQQQHLQRLDEVLLVKSDKYTYCHMKVY